MTTNTSTIPTIITGTTSSTSNTATGTNFARGELVNE